MDSNVIERKRRSETMGKYIRDLPHFNDKPRTDLRKLAKNVDTCASWLLYHEYSPEDIRLTDAVTCKKHLLCPFCASRRGSRSIQKNIPKVNEYMQERPGLIPVLLTLTVKNGNDLQERYLHLVSAMKRMLHKRRNQLNRKTPSREPSQFAKIDGGIYSIEYTFSQDHGWHPHVHMVAFLTGFIDQKALSKEWLSLTSDSDIVDIRLIRAKSQGHGALGIEGALCEVYKYAVKFSDLTEELTWHAYQVLNKKRLTGVFGALRGRVIEEDDLLDDELENTPFTWRLYRWSRRQGTYNISDSGYSDGCRPTVDEAPQGDGEAADLVNLATGEITPRPALVPVETPRTSSQGFHLPLSLRPDLLSASEAGQQRPALDDAQPPRRKSQPLDLQSLRLPF